MSTQNRGHTTFFNPNQTFSSRESIDLKCEIIEEQKVLFDDKDTTVDRSIDDMNSNFMFTDSDQSGMGIKNSVYYLT